MKPLQWIVSFIWLAAVTGAQFINRADFLSLWGWYTLGFAAYAILIFRNSPITLTHGLALAIVCRIIGFFCEPLLSDDYYRFIWDGMVSFHGLNPMAYTPAELMSHALIPVDPNLYSLLNSQAYYSVYPPVSQGIFYLSYAINHLHLEGHILFYKSILLFADILVFYLLWKLLKQEHLSSKRLLIYALNPLIIIEFGGNLHMEGFMIAGLLLAILFSHQRIPFVSSLFMTFSISSKILTALLLPFMPLHMYRKKIIIWSTITCLLTLFVFYFSFRHHGGWVQSILLWFRSFEFNASLYYVIREVDAIWRGYENIHVIGPAMAIMSAIFTGVIWLYYLKKNFHWSAAMCFVLTSYFLMSTTVHPWYLSTLLVLSVFSGFTYPIVWTYLVFLSYSHYSGGGFSEQYILIGVEYVLLFVWMFFEIHLSPCRLILRLPYAHPCAAAQ